MQLIHILISYHFNGSDTQVKFIIFITTDEIKALKSIKDNCQQLRTNMTSAGI